MAKKTKKPTKLHDPLASERAREAIESYVQTLKDLDPETMAELANTVQKVAGIMFPPTDYAELVRTSLRDLPTELPPPPVPKKHPHPYRLPEGISPRMEKIDAQMMTLRDLLAVAVSAKQLGDEWNFVVQYCLKLADEIVPDEHTPEETK